MRTIAIEGKEEMVRRVLEHIVIDKTRNGSKVYKCAKCGTTLGPANKNFKEYAVVKEAPYGDYVDAGILATRSDRFVIREFYCPKCAVRFDVERVAKGEPYLDIKIRDD